MPKKPAKKPSGATTARQLAREFLLDQYERLQKSWNRKLQNDSTDWVTLFHLHYQIAALEQRSPWLKKETLS
jgi:hypothetical protein